MRKLTKMKSIKKICPCCEQHDFIMPNNYEACPICHWKDDLLQRMEPDFKGGANKLSLNEYKIQWAEIRMRRRGEPRKEKLFL
jgi:hypothetical protein